VVEVYTGILDNLYFTNAVTDILLEEGAHIEHYKVQNETRKSFHVALLNVRQERGSRFSSHLTGLGGAIGRHEVHVALMAEDAEATLNGLYLPDSGQYLDNPILVEHAAPRCTSRQLYKGVIDGEGRGGFYGRIIVEPDAMKTDARQSNKVLLLSESAQADTRPRLEILADDVQCAHGATVGQLNDEALFYLRSRGISLDNARGLLTYAFVSEMLNLIALKPLQSYLTELIFSRFSITGVPSPARAMCRAGATSPAGATSLIV
jgi:Fe-S cluster assembly protein SufD